MLRGRHRGLPVAIDRAVMLPAEYKDSVEFNQPHEELRGYARSRSSTTTSRPEGWQGSSVITGLNPGEDPNRLSAHMASGTDHRDKSPMRGRDIAPRRPRRGSALTNAGTVRSVGEQTNEIVDELVHRGGLMV